jgi:acyl-CoA reductase-like NAD-dependent aldehyde dehydrogenase
MPARDLFVDGAWAPASGTDVTGVIDSFTEEVFGSYRVASVSDVDIAVDAARRALPSWSAMKLDQRIAAVLRVASALETRADELARVISREVGMPLKLSRRIQVEAPIAAWRRYGELARGIEFERWIEHSLVRLAPVGVVACITPWNYPLHQITAKVAPALLAGCSIVLKPAELAPSSAFILAEAIEHAGLPPGVFNLVHGSGSEIGDALVRHTGIDMISFTGSTRVGRSIAAIAGNAIKRVALELGGKSAGLVLPGADLAQAGKATLGSCFLNSGQTCSAITRLIVPNQSYDAVVALAREFAATYAMGDPADPTTRLGPLISRTRQQEVLSMIRRALDDGAQKLTPDFETPRNGFFVPPTVVGNVTPGLAICQEEVFGPVLAVIPYTELEEGIAIANGTSYGLAGAVWGSTAEAALPVALRIRAGQVDVQGAPFNPLAPFGGLKQSGLGRENGHYGIEEFLEPISVQLPPAYFTPTSKRQVQ